MNSPRNLALIIIPIIALGIVRPSISPVFAEATTSAKPKPITTLNQEKKAVTADLKNNLKETIQIERANFKAKLAEIKDLHKKTIVEKLDAKITERNKARTTEMSSNIEKMQKLLGRIRTKLLTKEASSNKTACETALNTNDLTLKSTKEAITTQAGQTYVIQITTEQNLGQAVKAAIQSYETAIKSLFQKVLAAREATLKTVAICKPLLLEVHATPSAVLKKHEQQP